jgi:TolA-binding protein
MLSLANSYRDAGSDDKARSKYQDVIAQFPSTPEADAAKSELAKLPQ